MNQLTPLPGWHPWNKEPNFPGWTQLTPNWHPNYKSWDGLSWHPWPPADTPLLVLGWTQLTPSWHPMYFLWKISYKLGDGLSWHPADTPEIVIYKGYTLTSVPRIDPNDTTCIWQKKFLISPGMDSAGDISSAKTGSGSGARSWCEIRACSPSMLLKNEQDLGS